MTINLVHYVKFLCHKFKTNLKLSGLIFKTKLSNTIDFVILCQRGLLAITQTKRNNCQPKFLPRTKQINASNCC